MEVYTNKEYALSLVVRWEDIKARITKDEALFPMASLEVELTEYSKEDREEVTHMFPKNGDTIISTPL